VRPGLAIDLCKGANRTGRAARRWKDAIASCTTNCQCWRVASIGARRRGRVAGLVIQLSGGQGLDVTGQRGPAGRGIRPALLQGVASSGAIPSAVTSSLAGAGPRKNGPVASEPASRLLQCVKGLPSSSAGSLGTRPRPPESTEQGPRSAGSSCEPALLNTVTVRRYKTQGTLQTELLLV
jgi:hypothetical protein